MGTRYGTSHFADRQAARAYYRRMNYSSRDTDWLIEAGTIHLGPPPLKPGERLELNRDEGRYFIEESDQ
jgi:hypothetical protein